MLIAGYCLSSYIMYFHAFRCMMKDDARTWFFSSMIRDEGFLFRHVRMHYQNVLLFVQIGDFLNCDFRFYGLSWVRLFKLGSQLPHCILPVVMVTANPPPLLSDTCCSIVIDLFKNTPRPVFSFWSSYNPLRRSCEWMHYLLFARLEYVSQHIVSIKRVFVCSLPLKRMLLCA